MSTSTSPSKAQGASKKPQPQAAQSSAAHSSSQAPHISMLQLAILTVVAVASLRSLPTTAEYGLGSIAIYIIPAVFFLIPTALVAAELATGWKGGVYVWVREAFDNRLGFVAIWLQWIQNVVWYPVQLAFCAAAIAYMIGDSALGNSGFFTALIIVGLYWLSTFITLKSSTLFARIGSAGGIIGTIIPGIVLMLLGIVWLALGLPSQTPLKAEALNPFVSSSSTTGGIFAALAPLVLIVSNFLAYAGMEVNAVHVNDMENPGRDYPKSILIACVLILVVFIVPTISIAVIVPAKDLGLTTGILEAFHRYFAHWGMDWLTPILSGMIVIGALASVVTWIAGPSKGVLLAGETGLLPPMLQKRNSEGAQEGIMILQGIIVTVLAALFLVPGASVSTAFFMLVDMAAALYLIMYMLMFASVIILRKKHPEVKRSYTVPAVHIVAGIGFLASLAAFLLGFIPPAQLPLPGMPGWAYPALMIAVIVVLGVPPFIFYAVRKPSWKKAATK